MNAYLDLIMIQVGPFLLREGWVPMDLPDFHESIEHRVILITYTGELNLYNGVLTRLVSVARSGNSFMGYANNMLRIQVVAGVRQLAVSHFVRMFIENLSRALSVEVASVEFSMLDKMLSLVLNPFID